MSDYKFETLQLHVGQEEPDPASDAEQYRFTRQHLMYLRTLHMQQQDSDLQMQVTFTDV